MKILVATEKPFAKAAVDGIRNIVEEAGHTLVLLEKYTSPDQLIEAVADADALIVRSDKVTADVVAAAKKLKIVVRAGAGYDNLDLAACSEKGIVAMNTPGQNSNAVAELVFGMLIYLQRACFSGQSGTELKGKKLGLHAFGNIGKIVAKIAKGFGMEVMHSLLHWLETPNWEMNMALQQLLHPKSCMIRATSCHCICLLTTKQKAASITL